ncbi:MAG TPA: glycine zipper domain-containing protein [Burkholderiaceae bacterium]|nr:glycine zipper domain-containing protein [Burkholderiaceae bacterium]HYB49938.1 glycine zipper domain-containing protein [Burkholderiaceae bacterium]
MMAKFNRIVTGAMALSLVAAAGAQAPIVYPARGQSPQQQNQDEGECYVWAKQSTGIDPAVLAATPVQAQQQPAGGTVLRGAAGGAVAGTAIGAISGNAGKGAAIGAVVGTMGGAHRASQNQAAANQQAQANRQQQINTFYRAQAACLSGRGYTVN